MDLKLNKIHLAHDRERWRAIVNMIMNLPAS